MYDSHPAGTNTPNPPQGTGSGLFAPGEVRLIKAVGVFGIPTNAKAILANITVTSAEGGGYLSAYPANLPDINTSAVNWYNSPSGLGPRTIATCAVIS